MKTPKNDFLEDIESCPKTEMLPRHLDDSAYLLLLCYKMWLLGSDCTTTSTFFQFPQLRSEHLNATFISFFIRLNRDILVTTCKVHRELIEI